MSNALLLIGKRALELRERLEASGYSTLGWRGAEAVQSLQSQLVSPERVQAVLIASDEIPLVPLLQRHCGAGELVPLLVEVEADDLAARKRVLEVGANDFWIHQAPPSELLRKLRQQLDVHEPTGDSLLQPSPTREVLALHDLRIDPQLRRVWRGTREIQLTEREFALLQLLLQHQGETVTRQQILEQVWEHSGEEANANVIEVYVRYLRRKLEEKGERRLIHTVRGQGYVLNPRG